MQQEARPLDRRQALEDDEEGLRQRVGTFHLRLGVARHAANQGLGQPRSDVALTSRSGLSQGVDRQPRSDRRYPGHRLVDLLVGTGQSQQGLLRHVLGLRDGPEHSVGDTEATPSDGFELRVG